MNDNEILDVPGAAVFLGVGEDAVYKAIKENRIPYLQVGKHFRLSRSAIVQWSIEELRQRLTVPTTHIATHTPDPTKTGGRRSVRAIS